MQRACLSTCRLYMGNGVVVSVYDGRGGNLFERGETGYANKERRENTICVERWHVHTHAFQNSHMRPTKVSRNEGHSRLSLHDLDGRHM